MFILGGGVDNITNHVSTADIAFYTSNWLTKSAPQCKKKQYVQILKHSRY